METASEKTVGSSAHSLTDSSKEKDHVTPHDAIADNRHSAAESAAINIEVEKPPPGTAEGKPAVVAPEETRSKGRTVLIMLALCVCILH